MSKGTSRAPASEVVKKNDYFKSMLFLKLKTLTMMMISMIRPTRLADEMVDDVDIKN